MKINIQKNILNQYEDINIIINAPEDTKEVEEIEKLILQISDKRRQIVGIKDNKCYILEISQIINFYSESKYNYCRTEYGIYRIKEKLYELEELLDGVFVRISNSCIINLNYIKMFDSNITGTIEVILKDNSKEYVSRRKVKEVLKSLKEWGNLK